MLKSRYGSGVWSGGVQQYLSAATGMQGKGCVAKVLVLVRKVASSFNSDHNLLQTANLLKIHDSGEEEAGDLYHGLSAKVESDVLKVSDIKGMYMTVGDELV